MGMQDTFRLLKVSRTLPAGDQVFVKASDGSICLCTIVSCSKDGKQVHVPLKLCDFCSIHNINQCPEVALRQGFQFKLCLGQAPISELCQKADSSIGARTIKQILENCINNSRTGELFRLDLEIVPSEENPITLEVRVDQVILPPQCIRKFPPVELEVRDARDISTNDWNPNLQVHWLERALNLKERGSHIIHSHPSEVNGKNIDQHKWSTAFGYYSRAFQLISLANLANETCSTTEDYGIRPSHGLMTTDTNYFDLNDVLPKEGGFSSDEVKPKQLVFNLLLNLALCQLKVGTIEFCAHNCSQALTLDPGWIDFATDLKSLANRATEWGIGYTDICKALFRRSQAYFNVGKLDEARSDLETSLRILKHNNADTSDSTFSATESLLGRVRERLSKEQALLASRLRNRQNLFS